VMLRIRRFAMSTVLFGVVRPLTGSTTVTWVSAITRVSLGEVAGRDAPHPRRVASPSLRINMRMDWHMSIH
jgi:hypothetical protein